MGWKNVDENYKDPLLLHLFSQICPLHRYPKLTERGLVSVASSALRVGDIVVIEKGMRAPADVVLLRTTDTSGASFIRCHFH
jgi:magnesium-transporting ATPase (P-type)